MSEETALPRTEDLNAMKGKKVSSQSVEDIKETCQSGMINDSTVPKGLP
jgi:hypothetical protein